MREPATYRLPLIALLVSICSAALPAAAQITIDLVTIGDTGNAPDPATGIGSVATEYRIGATEVTSSQYAAFLNAVAASNPHGLYSPLMGNDFVGILQSGPFGSYTYTVRQGFEDFPVAYISFLDAMRFVNWLHNGQGDAGTPEGETETGVYTITNGQNEPREAGARYFLPSADEWYKAAYYQPQSDGGDSDSYWLYPTSSNSTPISGIHANYDTDGPTPVGSFAPNASGMLDMGGNLYEWTEQMEVGGITERVLRGGSWFNSSPVWMQSLRSSPSAPQLDSMISGFRVAAPPAGQSGCNPADLSKPFGTLDLADITAFIDAFVSGDLIADIAPPMGLLDLSDITAFVSGFTAGCP